MRTVTVQIVLKTRAMVPDFLRLKIGYHTSGIYQLYAVGEFFNFYLLDVEAIINT